MNNDYLKYWRVIRYFIKAKYNLTQGDLDVILFLNSEGYFDKAKFDEFDELKKMWPYQDNIRALLQRQKSMHINLQETKR